MEYKASLDLPAKIITSAVIIILAVVDYLNLQRIQESGAGASANLIHLGIIFLSILVLLISYVLSPQKYIADGAELVIVRPANNVHILVSEIEDVRLIAKGELRWTIRTFGVGGLFGYFGKYYNNTFGAMTWYTTQLKNRILIRLKSSKKIVITPDNIALADFLKSKIKSSIS